MACAGALAWSTAAPAEPAAASQPAAARCSDALSADELQDAAQLYRQFECRFLRGDYQSCLPFLQKACTLTNSPRCAFNLGAVHHALMHCELARSYYLRYLELAPYDDNGSAARGAIAELALSCGERPVNATLPAAPPGAAVDADGQLAIPPLHVPLAGAALLEPDSEAALAAARKPAEGDLERGNATESDLRQRHVAHAPQPPLSRTIGWWLLGAGAASGAASMAALLQGARADQDATARDLDNGKLGLANDAELRAIDRSGHRANRLAWAFGGASALLLGAGATLLFVDFGSGAGASVGADATAWLHYRGSF